MSRTVLVTGARAPSAAHAARLFHEGGYRVFAADAFFHVLTRNAAHVEETFQHPAPRHDYEEFRTWLGDLIRRQKIDLIYPTCEDVFHFARALEDLGMGGLMFSPDLSTLLSHHDKFTFIGEMRKIGMPVPQTQLLTSPAEVVPLVESAQDLVFKPVMSRFGSRVMVRPHGDELLSIPLSERDPWVAQEALTGVEICVYVIARAGRVMALSAYEPRHRAGVGAGIYFEPRSSPQITSFAERFVKATNWTGQVSFDCIDTEEGLIAIECNPRTTSGIHAFMDGRAFVSAVEGTDVAVPHASAQQIVPAMWRYGLPQAVRSKQVRRWWRDLKRAKNAFGFANVTARSALLCFWEVYRWAKRNRISVSEATTFDIEWNERAKAVPGEFHGEDHQGLIATTCERKTR